MTESQILPIDLAPFIGYNFNKLEVLGMLFLWRDRSIAYPFSGWAARRLSARVKAAKPVRG